MLITGLRYWNAAMHGPNAQATALNWATPGMISPVSLFRTGLVRNWWVEPGLLWQIAINSGLSKLYEISQLPNCRAIASSRPLHSRLYLGVTLSYTDKTMSATVRMLIHGSFLMAFSMTSAMSDAVRHSWSFLVLSVLHV